MTRVHTEPGRRTVVVVVLAFLLGIGLAAEFTSYAGSDTGFLLDAAARVLDGARLYVDVVEINPPLIIALNMIAVLSARVLDIPDILAYRLGFTAVLIGALVLAGWLLRRVFPQETGLRRIVLLLLAFALFPLAGEDFGEREHLVLALLVPYLLLATARRLGRDLGRLPALAIGVLGGVAFALKPHFLILWLLVEVLVRAGRRVAPKAILPETLGIAGFLTVYAIALLTLTPQYTEVVRLLAGPYGRFLYDPFLHVLFTGPGALLAIFALLAFAAVRPHARHPELWQAIALGTAACLVAGAAQQKGLRYHLYPSFALGTVLLGLIACDTVRPLSKRLPGIYRRLAIGVLAATVVVVCVGNAAALTGAGRDADRDQFEELVRLVRSRAAGEDIYVMSYHLSSAYPLVNYGGARSASRFPHLWILAAEYLDELKSSQPLVYRDKREMSPSERYLNLAVLEDLREHTPRLLIVFRHARDLPVNGLRRLDFVAYFARDPGIARIFQDYQLVAELGDYLVYERVSPGVRRTGPPPTVTPGTRDALRVRQGGMHLRLGDPSLLIAVLAFVISLGIVAVVERKGQPL